MTIILKLNLILILDMNLFLICFVCVSSILILKFCFSFFLCTNFSLFEYYMHILLNCFYLLFYFNGTCINNRIYSLTHLSRINMINMTWYIWEIYEFILLLDFRRESWLFFVDFSALVPFLLVNRIFSLWLFRGFFVENFRILYKLDIWNYCVFKYKKKK